MIIFVRTAGEVPGSTVSLFDATPTTTGTFVSLALLITSDPASEPLEGFGLRIKIGVLVTVASIIVKSPTVILNPTYYSTILVPNFAVI